MKITFGWKSKTLNPADQAVALQAQIRSPGENVEMISVVGWDFDDVMMLPEWAQTADQGHLIAAVVFQAKAAIERKQG